MSLVRRLPHPVARVGHAVPNGFLRSKTMRLRAWKEGVVSGVLDWHYPGPSHDGRHTALWIEFKVGDNTLTAEQRRFAEEVAQLGNQVIVCYSWQEAWQELLSYLGIEVQK